MHAHSHGGWNSVARKGGDTTRTQTLQAAYARRLRAHLDRIAAQIRTDVGERDVFRLERTSLAERLDLAPNQDGEDDGQDDEFDLDQIPTYEFPSDEQKVDGFKRWLEDQIEQGILKEITVNDNRYIRGSYKRGIKNADARLRRAGAEVVDQEIEVLLDLPTHAERIQGLYSRNYTLLDEITSKMGEEMGRVLARSFVEGTGPDETARNLTDRIDKIGKTRSTTLARTEVMNAHHEAAIERYQTHDVEMVDVLVHEPCPICQQVKSLAPYELRHAENLLPAHPNCVCSLAPVVNA